MVDKDELLRLKIAKDVRDESDRRYSYKFVQHIMVYSLVALGTTALGIFINFLIRTVLSELHR